MIGKFVIASIPFAEGDGRYKVRPALVLAEKKIGNDLYYLLAPKFSCIEKVRGGNEVVMSVQDAIATGTDKEGVLRLSRENLAVVPGTAIIKVLEHYNRLPSLKAKAVQNAARRIGLGI